MGRKFRMRENADYRFIKNGKPFNLPGGIVDEDDPDFKGQAHKFHPDPVPESAATAAAGNAVTKDLESELARIAEMKRPELLALVQRVAKKDPPDAATAGELRGMLAEVATGRPANECFDEAFAAKK